LEPHIIFLFIYIISASQYKASTIITFFALVLVTNLSLSGEKAPTLAIFAKNLASKENLPYQSEKCKSIAPL
jgi:hypothetical protein